VPSTTVGYEKRANWALAPMDETEFVRAVLEGQPEPPRYFAQMKRINKEGPRALGGFPRPARLPVPALRKLVEQGELVVDTRAAEEFAAGHAPRTLNIPLGESFTTWAGWLLPYDRDVYLLVDAGCAHCVEELVRDLAMIGLDRVSGVIGAEALDSWTDAEHALETVRQVTPVEAAQLVARGEALVVDVRGQTEWAAGHLPAASNIPLGYLADRIDELPTDRLILVQCRSGARSAIAASVLQRRGRTNVANVIGGIVSWQQGGLPIEREEHEVAAGALASV
jgi:hydroxyacylglutathione hydrolase